MTYALDANIIIHLLRDTPAVIMHYDSCIAQSIPIVVSPYVDYEIRRGLRYANATAKQQEYQRLCESCEIGEMRRDIWTQAVNLYSDLRHRGFTVCDSDILIAAFCIANEYTLVTNNTKDFRNMNSLKMVDWVL